MEKKNKNRTFSLRHDFVTICLLSAQNLQRGCPACRSMIENTPFQSYCEHQRRLATGGRENAVDYVVSILVGEVHAEVEEQFARVAGVEAE
jgi:hypothetical protein